MWTMIRSIAKFKKLADKALERAQVVDYTDGIFKL